MISTSGGGLGDSPPKGSTPASGQVSQAAGRNGASLRSDALFEQLTRGQFPDPRRQGVESDGDFVIDRHHAFGGFTLTGAGRFDASSERSIRAVNFGRVISQNRDQVFFAEPAHDVRRQVDHFAFVVFDLDLPCSVLIRSSRFANVADALHMRAWRAPGA